MTRVNLALLGGDGTIGGSGGSPLNGSVVSAGSNPSWSFTYPTETTLQTQWQ